MATYNKFQAFVEHLAEGVHNLQSHTLKIMLVNSPAPVATNSLKADLTEIAAGNGYTAGGVTVTISASAQAAGTYKATATDGAITATGGTVGPFRYAVLYNDTPTSPADPLIAWWDYGSSISLLDGEPLNLDFDGINGLLQIA
jgi:hypothetical protein